MALRMQPLVGLEKSELIQIVTGRGEPAYRAGQIYDGIYQGRAETVEQIRGLPGMLRRALGAEFEVGLPAIERQFRSTDGAVRYLLRLADGQTIETVWMPESDRDTICISTQAGCANLKVLSRPPGRRLGLISFLIWSDGAGD